MNETDEWQARNAQYLGAALGWIRARLERHTDRMQPQAAAAHPESVAAAPPEATSSDTGRWSFFRRSSDVRPPVPQLAVRSPILIAAAPAETDEERMVAAAADDPPLALPLLVQRFEMSDFERNILLLCAAAELDTRVGPLCALVQAEPARPWPTFALAMALFDDPEWEALSPERPLRYWRMLEINQPAAQPLTLSALRADERIVSYVKGLNYLDDRLAPLVLPMPFADAPSLPPSQRVSAEAIVTAVNASSPNATSLVVRLAGADRPSKRIVASAASASLGRNLYRMPAAVLPTHAGELETLSRLWQRESRLLPIALYVDAHALEKGAAPEGLGHVLSRFLTRTGGLVFLDTPDGVAASSETLLTVDIEKPTPAEQREAWQAALGESAADAPATLAAQFNLNIADIHDIAARVQQQHDASGPLLERLWQQALAKTRPGLDSVAENLVPKADWSDIVLPKPEAALLQQIAAQVAARAKVYDEWGFRARMNRGLGISALFAGDSGTGKTMAAEVIANALKLNLFRIDLSAVVSKYIGETEKNLRQVFDAAEDGGAILFFDEADALFGKRSEVKDAHDRYANIEINYLLQRMEAYRGLCILATNMKSALDPAFMRRMRFIVNFPFPGPAERKQIWERVFPPGTPLGVIDCDRLSRLSLTGGNIHNIALNAAFLAAHARTPVSMSLILEAARTELRKLDRAINEAELRWVEPAGAAA
jgi:hypothetical protein